MTGNDDNDRQERALWRRYREGRGSSSPLAAPDANVLAAWLEGRAGPEESEAVEAWFAEAPDGADELSALRAILAEAHQAAPGAPAYQTGPALARRAEGPSLGERLHAFVAAWQWPQAAVAAAAVVLACWLGFGLGGAVYDARQEVTIAMNSELSTELDEIAEDEIAFLEEDVI